jgi:hypothetical protein
MEDLVPSAFYLSQNSPNPVDEKTKIKYCLPVKAKVNLILYNSSGKKVKELVNKYQEAGTYEIKINGHNFENGNYTYRLQAVDKYSGLIFVETKQMTVKEG